MRGTRRGSASGLSIKRIIPAHAGNSAMSCVQLAAPPDHPRACGELRSMNPFATASAGSSPRMRGTRFLRHRLQALRRIIPAHAGNSSGRPNSPAPLSDHPRACGELLWDSSDPCSESGSSPRMRGTRECAGRLGSKSRIIPAHAGNSVCRWSPHQTISDHPRACGELGRSRPEWAEEFGSSPRMRGTRGRLWADARGARIIPAHAGNSCAVMLAGRGASDHPRACGELRDLDVDERHYFGSSPRMRGTLSVPPPR